MSVPACLLWLPAPFSAGFCITDDTDAATFEGVKIVYDYLSRHGLLTTKTVWPFPPKEKSGIPATPGSTLRGITLEDAAYRSYCRELHAHGFEIALHGASAGNNKRESTAGAFALLEREFSRTPVYICHSKNAENIYWGGKTIPWKWCAGLAKIGGSHVFSGEKEDSPYFWGDICFENVRFIRLFRTRNTNTLKTNPSMPYHDPRRPFVRGWFSATKRSFHDCTTPAALQKLKDEHGLTVLYQYLHRYADHAAHAVDHRFAGAVERLTEDKSIWIRPAGTILTRLQQMQGVFCFYRRDRFWLLNTNYQAIDDVQVQFGGACTVAAEAAMRQSGDTLAIDRLPGRSLACFKTSIAPLFRSRRCFHLSERLAAKVPYGFGDLYVNAADEERTIGGKMVGPRSFLLENKVGTDDFTPMSRIGFLEEVRLFSGQVAIILREILFKGRKLNSRKFLGAETIALENHDIW
ncbi:MAG: hypothetical protein JW913_17045 [Chitinispirillaceae bacterium]|nr:hypothetical protein [Chitinispirillaceae bacterium]